MDNNMEKCIRKYRQSLERDMSYLMTETKKYLKERIEYLQEKLDRFESERDYIIREKFKTQIEKGGNYCLQLIDELSALYMQFNVDLLQRRTYNEMYKDLFGNEE